ncbi:MAG: leucine-rich repeat protein [Lachnospiraceae bacterium]|nr:leucine-rich repeat protein [Lachnospiraceae bacterium]
MHPTVEYLATTNKKASTIKVPDSVTVDGVTYKVTVVVDKALAGNKKVKKVVLGVNVTGIGKNAFANCKNLKKIEVKSSQWNKKSVGKNAFKGTSKKLVVKVPKKMASAYKKYIKGKGNKTVRVK